MEENLYDNYCDISEITNENILGIYEEKLQEYNRITHEYNEKLKKLELNLLFAKDFDDNFVYALICEKYKIVDTNQLPILPINIAEEPIFDFLSFLNGDIITQIQSKLNTEENDGQNDLYPYDTSWID